MDVIKDVTYKCDGLADIYREEEPGNASWGTVILIHGGGWFRGDKLKEASLARRLVADGLSVVAPNYRLAPSALYPAALEDILAVYDWVASGSAPVGATKIAAFGSSAGGNLSLELALQRGAPAISWSGIIDMDDWVAAHPDVVAAMNQKPDFDAQSSAKIDQDGSNDPFYKWFILNYVNSDLELLREASPLQRVTADAGPVFAANSLNEIVPVSGVFKLQHALTNVGVASEVKILGGTEHGEGYADHAYAASLAFLKEQLG